jgi:hypothetical protein
LPNNKAAAFAQIAGVPPVYYRFPRAFCDTIFGAEVSQDKTS